MNEQEEEQNPIRGYLLGQLNENERQLVEERIFTDPAFFADVQMTEQELLEDYVFEILPAADAERFASRLLLTPEQIHSLETTRALKKYAEHASKKNSPTPVPVFRRFRSSWGLAMAATLIVAIAIGIWIRRTNSLEQTVAALNVAGESSEMQSDYPIELPALRFRSEPTENTPEQRVAIPKNVGVVQIRLPLETDAYRSYQTTLIREPHTTLFTLNDRSPIESGNRKLLVVRVPANALVRGDYRLAVKGITADGRVDDLGTYVFSIL